MNQQQATATIRKPIELWQFILALAVLIGSFGAYVINQSSRLTSNLTSHEIRISDLEQNKRDTKDQFDKMNLKQDQMNDNINGKFEEVNNQLTTIRIALEDKKNR